MSYLQQINAVSELLHDDDHFDVKTIEGEVTLREFIVGMLGYHPIWIKALYTIRSGFVRLLGMTQQNIPVSTFTPQTVPFEVDKWSSFFQVYSAQENAYWIGTAHDEHLDAYIIIAQEPLENGKSRFHVGTIVHYNNWAGPIYFNVIRPFHHLVVQSMMQAGVDYQRTQEGIQYA
ncbi:MAG: DUF2867 domain-containing protein [Phototrophicaceae bacterium]